MSRATLLTYGPFALVAVIALVIAALGFVSSPRLGDQAAVVVTPARDVPPPLAAASAPASPSSAGASPAAMLDALNELRAAVGAPAVRGDARVIAAAQRHAEYLAHSSALGHEETPGVEGFSGATVRDRLAAQGIEAATASEVVTSFSSAIEGVRALWVMPYHRLGLMHPHLAVAGWGFASREGRPVTVGVLLFDFAAAAPDTVRVPASGQRVAPSWDGEESPDALPAGAPRPVGYPVMVVYAKAKTIELRGARLTDRDGREVPHHVVAQLYERDYAVIIPVAPLARGSRYHVRFELRVDGSDVVEEWEFETEG
jgi:uncharacterized protein YkwD